MRLQRGPEILPIVNLYGDGHFSVKKLKKRPSDFFGSISEKEGEQMHVHLNKSRGEWERNI